MIPAVAVYAGVNFDTKNNPYVAPGVEGISPKIMIATQNNFAGGWVFVLNLIKDRIVVINFIYTKCPDTCPLETAQLVDASLPKK